MVAQATVLGKDYSHLRTTLESPCIDEAKAFEAMTQLAVLVRLLSEKEHELVPPNPLILDSLDETEMFHIEAEAKTLAAIMEQVSIRFHKTNVLQVVAVPLFASFPTYDTFLLHFDKEERKAVECYRGDAYFLLLRSRDIIDVVGLINTSSRLVRFVLFRC
jgi:hypothetical protein